MKIKQGVSIENLEWQAHYMLGAVEMAYRIRERECVVTSTRDSHENRPHSLHNRGLAVDFRTRHLTPSEQNSIYNILRSNLDPLGFDTVLEKDHIHVEFQPKEGEHLISVDRPFNNNTVTPDFIGES